MLSFMLYHNDIYCNQNNEHTMKHKQVKDMIKQVKPKQKMKSTYGQTKKNKNTSRK